MWFRKRPSRPVFTLTDVDDIGAVLHRDADDAFDDIFSGRDAASQHAGTYVGNVLRPGKLAVGGVLVGLALTVFLGRVTFWQIIQGAEHRALADANRTRTVVLPADRGVLKDRNGLVLAWNEPSFRLLAVVRHVPEGAEGDAVLAKAANMLGGDTAVLVARLAEARENDDADVLLLEDVDYDRALTFLSLSEDFPGLTVELGARRAYITDAIPTLSHVLGYTGAIDDEAYQTLKTQGYRRFDDAGKMALEKQYETQLRGSPGVEVLEVDSLGLAIRTLSRKETVDGTDITLTVDAQLTAAIEKILDERLKALDVKRAAVIAMQPSSGEILALVSYPSFNANMFTGGISNADYAALVNDPNAPLFPRATSGGYPSGSTIKPVYAAAALMEGAITPATSFLSVGGIWVGPKFYPDWRAGGHGITNVYHAIADSVNTFFYIIGGGNESFNGLGLETLMRYAALFGFGSKSGIDLPSETPGFLPSKSWKEEEKGEPWYIGDTYNVSIGQGDFLVNPLQVARATAVFANGGLLVTPHLAMDAAVDVDDIVPDEVVAVIRDAMRRTVTQGSATSMSALPIEVAGKTGTAQWSNAAPPHSWFTGFAPFEDPQIVLTVLIENGGDVSLAVPVSREILDWWSRNQYVSPEAAVD